MNCKCSGLRQQQLIFSQFWRPEDQNQHRVGASWRLRGRTCPRLLPAPGGAGDACFLGLWPRLYTLCLSPHGLLPASKIVSPYRDISCIGIKARQDGFVLTTSAKTLTPNKVPFTGLGGYEFGGVPFTLGLPRCLSSKEPSCNARAVGDISSIPGSGKSPGGEHGNPLQYSCLENPQDREPGGLRSMGSQRVRHA